MADPVQLTPDALESLLADRDAEAFAAFVADLYRRTGAETTREGTLVTAVAPDGDRERLLVWTDDRTRIERLLGREPPAPKVENIDAIVAYDRDAPSAAAIAEEAGAGVRDTATLHDRLLYAMDREACRELCREHFEAEVEPRPAPEAESEGTAFDALSRPRIALVAIAVCGLLVAGVAGLPGTGPSDRDAFVPGEGPGTVDPPGTGLVTPIGGEPGATPTVSTPPPTTGTPPFPLPGELVLLEPCYRDDTGSLVRRICLPPRPFSADRDPDAVAGARTLFNGTFGNPYDAEIRRALVGIETPRDWRTRVLANATFDAVGQGYVPIGTLGPEESRTISWVVTPPESAGGGRYNVTVISEWAVPGYESPNFVDNASTDASGDYFRVRKNYTYRVRPIECRGVDPCSLLANDAAGSEPFEVGTVPESATTTTAGYLYNPFDRTITNGTVTLDPPNADWNVTPANGTTFEALAPGESRPVAWNLTPPGFDYCNPGNYTLRGTATYELDGGNRITVPFSLDVAVRNTGVCLV
jgi:hypothetical protein